MPLTSHTVTPAQVTANQANAQKSRGPVTEEGRARATHASLKHGLYSRSFEDSIVALGGDPKKFQALHEDLIRYWKPTDAFRRTLVERLARILWTLEWTDRAHVAAAVDELERAELDQQQREQVVDLNFGRMLSALGFLIECANRRDFTDRQSVLEAYQCAYSKHTDREQRLVLNLLQQLKAFPEGAAGNGNGTEGSGSPAGSEPGMANEALCDELRRLLQREIEDCAGAREMAKWPDLNPFGDEKKPSRAAGAESVALIRRQDSLARQAERLVRLLAHLREWDHLGAYSRRRSGSPERGKNGTRIEK